MDQFWTTLTTVLVGIIGLATIAVVLSPKATTAGVINSGASGFASLLTAAEAPVTGAQSFGGLSLATLH